MEVFLKNLKTHGKLPLSQNAMYLRNGNGPDHSHVFDGHGLIHAFYINARRNTVSYKSRYVQTHRFINPNSNYLDIASLNNPLKMVSLLKNTRHGTANTSVYVFNKRLLAFHDLDMPYILDFRLNTIERLATSDVQSIVSHVKFDDDEKMYFTSYDYVRKPNLMIGCLDNTNKLVWKHNCSVKRAGMVHDFGDSEHYIVVMNIPMRLRVTNILFNKFPLEFAKKDNTDVVVVHKETRKERIFNVPSFGAYHVINCFEDGGTIYVDFLKYDTMEILDLMNLGIPSIARLVISDDITMTEITQPHVIEFPVINPLFQRKKYRYIWFTMNSVHENFVELKFDSFARYDNHTNLFEIRRLENHCYMGEMSFVRNDDNENEIDGMLVTIIVDESKKISYLRFYDANTLEKTCDIEVPRVIPYGLHGTYTNL